MLREKVDANERLRAEQEALGLQPGQPLPFLCECADVSCRAIIRLTGAEYGVARASAGRCACVEGHADGRVVVAGAGFVIVERD